jgi:hypothetical protein
MLGWRRRLFAMMDGAGVYQHKRFLPCLDMKVCTMDEQQPPPEKKIGSTIPTRIFNHENQRIESIHESMN